jgi:ribosomal protein S18 acetylase RimI-like enzyme
MTVTLRPMAATEWAAWRERAIEAYAADMVRVGAWPKDSATARAAAEFASLSPAGQATPGHEFRSIVSGAGETVGAVWFAPNEAIGRGSLFLWDIAISAAFRGHGYGRAALDALNQAALELGYDTIQLHVLGDNEIARNLYRSSGYVETDVSMVKHLR